MDPQHSPGCLVCLCHTVMYWNSPMSLRHYGMAGSNNLSPFEYRIRPILGPIRKSNIFSVSAVHVTHKFDTYFGIFCSSKGDKNKTELASILLNRLAVLKTVKDSPCRLVHHRLSTACLFIRIVACPVLSFYCLILFFRPRLGLRCLACSTSA